MADNSFKIKNSLVLTPVDLATLTNPQAGDLACDINDSNKIKRYDANSSAWTEVGSGGVGSVDIMFVQDFESASLSTFTQTGLSLSTTDPLHGKVSALLTHQAAINQSFKQIIPVDRKFRGQAMVLDLNVKSAASAGNVTIKITDETGSVDLIASEQLQLSNDVSGRRSSVSFTIPSTCASLSYTITALPEAGSPVTRIDDIVAMLSDVSLLETSVLVPNMTAWQGYTPTFQGFGTGGTGPTNIEFEWRQVGENVEIRGKFTAGTTTAVEAQIGLPAGLTSAGTSLIPSIQIVGSAGFSLNSLTITPAILIEPSKQYMTIGYSQSTNAALTKQTGTAVMSSGNSLSLFASVPCAGLSATTTKTIPLTQSGLVQEADSIVRLSNTTSLGTTATTIPRFINTQQNIGSAILYQDSPVNGASFTALETGVYSFSFCFEGPTTNYHIGLTKNQAVLTQSITVVSESERLVAVRQSTTNTTTEAAWTGLLNAGDIVRPNLSVSTIPANPSFCNFTASYQGSLKQVSVSSDQKITIPTSELRFEGASARGSTATAIVKFDTLAKIRGDAFTVTNTAADGTYITMNKAGRLSVSASVYINSASGATYISKNQAILTSVPVASEQLSAGGSTSSVISPVAWSGDVAVGDIIRISTNTAPTSNASNHLNLSFQEQDISVSVTNTLPQFSDSDSYVRVTTGNGFGSTATTIRRFSNLTANVGTDIVYADSATAGASFTVQSAGVYNISYSDISATTTPPIQINVNGVLVSVSTVPVATGGATTTAQPYLQAGDVITVGSSSPAQINSTTTLAQVLISRVGKPNVTGVNVTPFVNVPQPESQFLSATGGSGANAIVSNFSGLSSTNNGIISQTASRLTALKRCNFSLFVRATSGGAGNRIDIYKNGSLYVTGITIGSGSMLNQVSLLANIGDYFEVYSLGAGGNTGISYEANAEATSDQILTAPETFSTDTASLSYASSAAYTLSTLQNAPVGTYITFTYAANTNTRTQTSTRPTQTDADMNANGMLVYTRTYNASSSAAQPTVIAIQIGKGLKGVSQSIYKSSGKVTGGFLDIVSGGSTNLVLVGAQVSYNEATGIFLIDAGLSIGGTETSRLFQYSDASVQTSGYLVINASKNPALTGFGLNRIAASGRNSSGLSIPASLNTTVTYNSAKRIDTHGALDAATGIFTAPETGYYQVSVGFNLNSAAFTAVNNIFTAQLVKNGVNSTVLAYTYMQTTTAVGVAIRGSEVISLAKGDTLRVQLFQNSAAAKSLTATEEENYFSIIKVSV